MRNLIISDKEFTSRLFLGTGKFGSNEIMRDAVLASGTEMVTAALKRVNANDKDDDMLAYLRLPNVAFLPNTSGARNAKEAVFAAELAREALQTEWVKLEIHPDPRYLLPDPIETLKAVEMLAQKGFKVMPYMQADPVLCKLIEEAGAVSVMPLASPIGTNKGITNAEMLRIIIEQSNVPVVIDAGIGAPSHASLAMEMGADAVLINTAVAVAGNPVEMAIAFRQAVEAGRRAFEAGIPRISNSAEASSPLTSFLK